MMRPLTPCILGLAAALLGAAASAESLRITLEPSAAVELQMRWKLAGETKWRPSGDTIDGLKPGIHELELTSREGCKPLNEKNPVRVLHGVTTHASVGFDGSECPSQAAPRKPLARP